jgi:hypothetical protein
MHVRDNNIFASGVDVILSTVKRLIFLLCHAVEGNSCPMSLMKCVVKMAVPSK